MHSYRAEGCSWVSNEFDGDVVKAALARLGYAGKPVADDASFEFLNIGLDHE